MKIFQGLGIAPTSQGFLSAMIRSHPAGRAPHEAAHNRNALNQNVFELCVAARS